jgi:Domain of unknown function (DUF397)
MVNTDPPALRWRKSSFSESGNCVEVADNKTVILVRDTKNRDRAILSFPLMAWGDFIRKIRTNSTSLR